MAEAELKTGLKPRAKRRSSALWIFVVLVVAVAVGGVIYWDVSSQMVYIDQSVIQAPVINLSPTTSGQLQAVFVNVGDVVTANQPIVRVGDNVVESKTGGEIISVDQNIGELENPGQSVVATMIDPARLRVVGHLDENKGLSDVKVGEVARFTVDTFGSKEYYGVVDEVGQASQLSVTSNIFNQRPVNEFNVYVRFDPARYPELKNGMSARIWVYLNRSSPAGSDLLGLLK
jgi:multidrug resistance efflux pump